MDIVLKKVNRIVVFLHPGQLTQDIIFPVTLLDCDPSFDDQLERYQSVNAIKLYDGPPNQ